MAGRHTSFLALLLLPIVVLPLLGSSDHLGDRVMDVVGRQRTAPLEARRRVYAPYFSETVEWADAGIFWFGRVDPPGSPGQNYADVRVAYNAEELVIYINIEDYYVWYDTDATPTSDLKRYDAVAVYLDTAHDRAESPQPEDYLFLSGLCLYGCGDGSNHRREARGTGAGWNFAWQGNWTDGTWASWWCNPGPNSNDCGFDFGWWSYVHIPWSTLGLYGPPAQGVLWGLGVLLYDRDDQPPAGSVAPEHWPETFSADRPSTWGELAFGLAKYTPTSALPQGTTIIRRGLGGTVVEDAWVGGGGGCTGGHEGDPEHDNYGGHADLYVENQSLIADFPCFSKSFLRFYLDDISPGTTIISATLTLHHWGNARGDLAESSLIWLFTVDGDWEEYALTWNNAPLARENLTVTRVDALPTFSGWPGVRYDWDATRAVAEAYAANEPLNVALYTADTNFHSSKYFKSSETGDWNEVARPTLTVVWGQPVATVDKRVRPVVPGSGEVITYTMVAMGSGHPLTLTDTLPKGLSDPGPIQATHGSVVYHAPQRYLEWNGTSVVGQLISVTFPVTVQISGPVALVNTVTLTDKLGRTYVDTAMIIIDGFQVYLPFVMR
jgi:hypothetical protein